MNTQTTIQLRIDTKTKRAAQKTLKEVGLDLSSAVKLFLRNVVITQSVPLELRTENGFTVAQELRILHETAEAKKNGPWFTDVDKLMDSI